MNEIFPICTLGEVASIKSGFAFRSADMGKVGSPVIKIRNVNPPNIDIVNVERVPFDIIKSNERIKKFLLEEGDVLIAMTGATVGKLGRFPKTDEAYYLNQRVGKLFLKKPQQANYDFLYYVLAQKKYVEQIFSSADGSAQPNVSGEQIEKFKIPLPSIAEQKAIASVMSALDDKIKNNYKMNDTLEEMARVIFKSWFVDFDPVHAKVAGNAPTNMKAKIAALFPNSFSDDGLPLGWVNNELSNVCSLLGGYAFKSQEFVNEGMPVVKIKNITGNGDVSLKDCQFIDSKSNNGKDKFKLQDGDLLIAMTGATVGKTGIITDGKMTPYLNQRVGKFVPKHSFYKWAIWAYLQFKKNVDAVVATGTGSAQTNISSPGIMSVKWTEAPHEIYKVFDEIVSPYFNLWISNRHQNQTLTALRDTLLPKLMSGEIRVKDAEHEVEAAL